MRTRRHLDFLITAIIALFPFSLEGANGFSSPHGVENRTHTGEEIELSGLVSDETGNPLRAAMVRIFTDGKPGGYSLTDEKGRFLIPAGCATDTPILLQISKIGYESESITLEPPYHPVNVSLSKSARTLKEVTVSAPEVRLRGDTVSYLLSAFISGADVTLKDALKKLPGIEVDKSGKISYNGKDISKFYIEGMDLLGGKYDLATTNIPASYVNAVEVIGNHQEKKIDRGIFSDNVAINVRLKRNAMFRPVGTYTLGAGLGKPLPWEASGAGMVFRNDFQSILTLKGSDIEEFSEREQRVFLPDKANSMRNQAEEALPSLSAASPPLGRQRWVEPVDAAASLNLINKIKEETTCRTNVDYAYRQTRYDFSDSRHYFDGTDDVEISQATNPLTSAHKTSLANEFRINSDNRYISNNFKGNVSFLTNDLPVKTPANSVYQHQKGTAFDLSNDFYWSWNRGSWKHSLEASLEYVGSPGNLVNIEQQTPSAAAECVPLLISQRAESRGFSGKGSFSSSAKVGMSLLSLPLRFSYADERLTTALSGDKDARNRLTGHTLSLTATPQWHLRTPYDRIVAVIRIPLEIKRLEFLNKGTSPSSCAKTCFLTTPYAFITFTPSSKSTLMLGGDFSRTAGDMLDFMTAPVMTDYLSATCRSGILRKENSFRFTFQYDFKLPLSMWFLKTDITYLKTHTNLETYQDVSEGLIVNGNMPSPNSSDHLNLSASLTKNIRTIGAKISLKGLYTRSSGSVIQNDVPVRFTGENSGISLTLSCRPVRWFELFYDGSFSGVSSHYLHRSRSYCDLNHDASISFLPTEAWQLRFSTDITDREIEPGRRKISNLFDVYAVFKHRKLRLSLRIRNLFDCRSYSYTVFRGLDRFSYDYTLRGRQLVAKVSFTL